MTSPIPRMIAVKRPSSLVMTRHIAAVRGALGAGVVTFFANRHRVLLIKEQGHIALVILLMMDNRRIRHVPFAYQQAAAAGPLACVIVPHQDPPA